MIVACRDCKNEISSQARICPHCGRHEPNINPRGKFYFWVGMLGFVLLLFLIGKL